MPKNTIEAQENDLVLLAEPQDRELSPEEIDKRTQETIRGISDKIEKVQSFDDFESWLDKLYAEINNLIGRKKEIEEDVKHLDNSKNELEVELENLNSQIKEKRREIDAFKWGKIHSLFDRINNAKYGIIFALGVGGAALGGVMATVNAIHTSPEEQVLLEQQYGDIRQRITTTLSSIGADSKGIDREIVIGDLKFKRRTEDVVLSERNFFDSSDFYQLESMVGENPEYKVILAVPFKAPENIIIGVGNIKTELTSPSIEEIQLFIEETHVRLADERIAAEEKLAQETADKERAAVEAAEKKAQETAEKKAQEEEDAAIKAESIMSSKEEVRSVLVRLTGDESVSLSSPFTLTFEENGIPISFNMLPKQGTGGLSDEEYLKDGKEYIVEGEGSINYNDDKYEFTLTFEINTQDGNNITGKVKYGNKTEEFKDYNGQDVSVLMFEIKKYLFASLG